MKNVEELDSSMASWDTFKTFVSKIKNEIGITTLDLLMCKIYSDADWRYVIENVENEIQGINIRSSDDNTGHIMFDGDWILESEDVDINMIRLYFTERIYDIEILLGFNGAFTNCFVSKDKKKLYFTGSGAGSQSIATNGIHSNAKYYRYVEVNLYSSDGPSYGSSWYVLEEGEEIIQLTSFYGNSSCDGFMFLTTHNRVFAFGGDQGVNSKASLGIGNHSDAPSSAVASGGLIKFPLLVKFQYDEDNFTSKKIRSIHFAHCSSYILFDDGDIYCAGSKYFSSRYYSNLLGDNSLLSGVNNINYFVKYEESGTSQFYQDSDEKPIKMVAAFGFFYVLTNKNRLYSQGVSHWENNYGDRTGRNKAGRQCSTIGLVQFAQAFSSNEYITNVTCSQRYCL